MGIFWISRILWLHLLNRHLTELKNRKWDARKLTFHNNQTQWRKYTTLYKYWIYHNMFNDRLTLRSNSSMPIIFSFAHLIFSLKLSELLHSTVVHSITSAAETKNVIDHKFADCRHIKLQIYTAQLWLSSVHFNINFSSLTIISWLSAAEQ